MSLNTTHGSTHGSLDLGSGPLLNRASLAHSEPRRDSNRQQRAVAAVDKPTIKVPEVHDDKMTRRSLLVGHLAAHC